MGVVSTKTATRLISAIHPLPQRRDHWHGPSLDFTGQGTLNMGLAACFSAMEIVPLTLLTLGRLGLQQTEEPAVAPCRPGFRHQPEVAIYFLMAVGVWTLVGAGVFGFLINLPIGSYFEMGTNSTANHAHAAMFGVFGMLALAVLVFA